jgi:hypothetical protein
MKSIQRKLITVGSIWTIAVLSLILFIPVLHWI